MPPATLPRALTHRRIAHTQAVMVTLRDVAAPRPLALPPYRGQLYIYVALGVGALWMVCTGLLLLAWLLVWFNMQQALLLPVFAYRYMRSARGW